MTRLDLIGKLMMLGETFDFDELCEARRIDSPPARIPDRALVTHLLEDGLVSWQDDENYRRVSPRYRLTPKAIEMFKQGEEP